MARDIREAEAKRKIYDLLKAAKAIRDSISDEHIIGPSGYEFELIRNKIDDILKELDPNALV